MLIKHTDWEIELLKDTLLVNTSELGSWDLCTISDNFTCLQLYRQVQIVLDERQHLIIWYDANTTVICIGGLDLYDLKVNYEMNAKSCA